jgi:hypothetical protein
MISIRPRIAAAIAAVAALAVGAQPAAASATTPVPVPGLLGGGLPALGTGAFGHGPFGGPCGTAVVQGQGATAGTESKICVGAGLVFVAPAIGQIATVIGPTIIGPAAVGSVVTSAGAVAGP